MTSYNIKLNSYRRSRFEHFFILLLLLQTNLMDNRSKLPLCNFINNCRNFKESGKCNFAHNKCKDGTGCKFGAECRFYHPERAGDANFKPRSTNSLQNRTNDNSKSLNKTGVKNVPCNFGANCKKRLTGQCHFNHDNLGEAPKLGQESLLVRQCKYGQNCKNLAQGKCKFKHSNTSQANNLPFQNPHRMQTQQKTAILVNKMNIQEPGAQNSLTNADNNSQFRQFECNKICPEFATGECDKQDCSRIHQFTTDNSVKRLYFKIFKLSPNSQVICKMCKLNGNRLFVLARGNTLAFYDLDDENQTLKSVCSSQIRLQANITNVSVNIVDSSKSFTIIIATSNNKIHKYFPLKGIIQTTVLAQSSHVTQSACIDQETIAVGNRSVQLAILKNEQKDMATIQKLREQRPDIMLSKATIVRRCQTLGESFLVIGSITGTITFINKGLQLKTIQLSNSQISDIRLATFDSKPFAFAVTRAKKYELIAINLLDFSFEAVLSSESLELSRACCVYDRLFVAIDHVGIVIYGLPDLSKIKGRIPFVGKISWMQGDGDGNLLVCSRNDQGEIADLISVYKIRK